MERDSLYSANTILTYRGEHALTNTESNTYKGIPSNIKAASAPEGAFFIVLGSQSDLRLNKTQYYYEQNKSI